MNVVACFFIILFFGYQYRKDPPQGAYVDKIMFLLLLYCSMEIFHSWSYIHAVEWEEFIEIFVIGQYVTIFILSLIAMFFALRLRFVTSVAGEFYENESVIALNILLVGVIGLIILFYIIFLTRKRLREGFFHNEPKNKASVFLVKILNFFRIR